MVVECRGRDHDAIPLSIAKKIISKMKNNIPGGLRHDSHRLLSFGAMVVLVVAIHTVNLVNKH